MPSSIASSVSDSYVSSAPLEDPFGVPTAGVNVGNWLRGVNASKAYSASSADERTGRTRPGQLTGPKAETRRRALNPDVALDSDLRNVDVSVDVGEHRFRQSPSTPESRSILETLAAPEALSALKSLSSSEAPKALEALSAPTNNEVELDPTLPLSIYRVPIQQGFSNTHGAANIFWMGRDAGSPRPSVYRRVEIVGSAEDIVIHYNMRFQDPALATLALHHGYCGAFPKRE